MRLGIALLATLLASACVGDETVAGYGAAGKVWVLQELDGVAFGPRATLTFPERHKIAGDAPCNAFFGKMSTPYPWFEAPELVTTRRACPELSAETQYLAALGDMSQSEVLGNVLILRNDAGREMVFRADD